jgi:small subunit ribosomal protein S6
MIKSVFVIYYKILVPHRNEGPEDQKEVKDSMNKYEVAVVVSARIEEEERTKTIEKVKEYITRFGGTITNVDEWGKKRLAYEIKKSEKMKEGFYYFIQVESDSNCPNEVEAHIRLMENVIRYLVVRQDA